MGRAVLHGEGGWGSVGCRLLPQMGEGGERLTAGKEAQRAGHWGPTAAPPRVKEARGTPRCGRLPVPAATQQRGWAAGRHTQAAGLPAAVAVAPGGRVAAARSPQRAAPAARAPPPRRSSGVSRPGRRGGAPVSGP